jgi:hypothetical protein
MFENIIKLGALTAMIYGQTRGRNLVTLRLQKDVGTSFRLKFVHLQISTERLALDIL